MRAAARAHRGVAQGLAVRGAGPHRAEVGLDEFARAPHDVGHAVVDHDGHGWIPGRDPERERGRSEPELEGVLSLVSRGHPSPRGLRDDVERGVRLGLEPDVQPVRAPAEERRPARRDARPAADALAEPGVVAL